MASLLILWNRQDIDMYKNCALVALSDLSAHGVEQTGIGQERHDGNQGVCSSGVKRKIDGGHGRAQAFGKEAGVFSSGVSGVPAANLLLLEGARKGVLEKEGMEATQGKNTPSPSLLGCVLCFN